MLDLIQKYFGYSKLWQLRPVCSQNRAWSYLPVSDFSHLIQFHSFEGRDHVVQHQPGSNLIAWSGFGQTHVGEKQAGVQESLHPVLAESNWPATSFPLSDLAAFFHRRPRSYCAKPAWLTVSGFCQTNRLEVSWCARICFWPRLPSWSRSDVNWIQHVYWVITSLYDV